MVDMSVETTEPDPAATSIGNDQSINPSKNGATFDALKETDGMSPIPRAYNYPEASQSDTSYHDEDNHANS